ncbi:hypothetical protein ACS0TY_006717 [Phlomoides rotata]
MAMKSANKPPKQLKSTAHPEAQKPQCLTYPGGYDPRQREPSYCFTSRIMYTVRAFLSLMVLQRAILDKLVQRLCRGQQMENVQMEFLEAGWPSWLTNNKKGRWR